jgi:hypothetical protein
MLTGPTEFLDNNAVVTKKLKPLSEHRKIEIINDFREYYESTK